MATYGIDVLDKRVTPRRIWTLLTHLPAGRWPESDHPMSWNVEAHLLANVLDQLAALTYVTARAYGATLPAPKPFPRPKAPLVAQAPGRRSERATDDSQGRVKMTWGALAQSLMADPEVTTTRHHA
jgi:hypothetical protein